MYLRIFEGFPRHPKTMALRRLTGNREAGMYMLRLWEWACRSAPTGDLGKAQPGDIEAVVEWVGAPGVCYAAMVAVGFIDETPDGRREIHDWEDWTGADVLELEADARRQRWRRRHARGKCGGAAGLPEPCPICLREGGGAEEAASAGRPPDIRRTSRVVQSSPVQARTEQREEKEPRESARPPQLFELVLDGFGQAWAGRYGEPYTPTPGDRSHLGRLLRSLKTPETASALPALFAAYLRDEDPFVVEKQRHSLSFFCTSGGLNKYRTKVPGGVSRPRANGAREREERGNEAAAKWLSRKEGSG
jgi:hypothetical protein